MGKMKDGLQQKLGKFCQENIKSKIVECIVKSWSRGKKTTEEEGKTQHWQDEDGSHHPIHWETALFFKVLVNLLYSVTGIS